ncbi:hypothetical protein COO60DRAFT_1694323 [Scenedesmus sp. NREL 46B-D3]|nr:hypothetical protein COO60DRAFT_1694323 [Scenedesmus sp. NREL 46B-D3]
MTEHVGNPFIAYNNTGNVATLLGNWQEETVLKAVTGTSRNKAAVLQKQAAAQPTVFAVRQDAAADELTHSRVVEHTEQLLPAEWITHNTVNFQPPAARILDLASYPKVKQGGPRAEQELRQLLLQAAAEPVPGAPAASMEITHRAEFQPHNMQGLQFGARVMRTQDGAPVTRDATFLAEAGILGSTAAHRLAAAQQESSSTGRRSVSSDSWGGSSLHKCQCVDPALPVTLYTEAAAKNTFAGTFYGTTTMSKMAPMNRNDTFTKLMSDINKATYDQ